MKNLIEYVKIRAKLSGRQLLSFDELAKFPAEQVKELEGKGILFQIKDADGIMCTECDEHCWKPVETRQKDGRAIGVIYCEDADCCGLIPVELERLQQWEIVTEKLLVLGYVAAPMIASEADELITLTEAGALLGVHKGTVSKWADDGKIKDNGKKGQKRKVSKASVLIMKHEREEKQALGDYEDFRRDIENIPDMH